MKRVVHMVIALVFTSAALFAQYTDESARRANANAAAARSLAQQALDAVQDLQHEQDRRQAEADRTAADTEKEELDRQVSDAQAANEQKRFDDFRRAQTAGLQGNSPAPENPAVLYTRLVESSLERALVSFPVFADPDGMQRLALDAYMQRALKDPTRLAAFADPNWPEKLTQEFAIKMKIAAVPESEPAAPKAAVKPMPDLFPVLTLANGRVLHDVTLKGFLSSSVLVKHQAGIESIAYTLFPLEYQPALELKKPRPKTDAEISAARESIDADARRLAEARAQTAESVRIAKAAARSDAIGRKSVLDMQKDAARDEIEKYFNYEYVNGSGPTRVQVKIETAEERPGWLGSYTIRGKAYLAFDYGRAVRRFEVETETRDGVVTAKVIRVE